MTALEEIRVRWAGADWRYRERILNNGRVGSVGIDDKDGTPIVSSPFVEDKAIFQLLGNAPQDILALLTIIDELNGEAE